MTRRKVIFPPDDYWTRPQQENTVTDTPEPAAIPNPNYTTLELPVDTINVGCTNATFVLTADADGSGKLVPQLAVETDMGWYRMFLSRDVFWSLLAQAEYFANLTPEQTKAIADQLNKGGDSA